MSAMNYPLTKVSDSEYIEGYWFESDNKIIYPAPKAELKKDKEFVTIFKKILDLNMKYLSEYDLGGCIDINPRIYREMYLGYSECRMCDKSLNGCGEYEFVLDGIKYIFPEGYLHYVDKHNVHPSKEFRKVIIDIYNNNKFIIELCHVVCK